ncbi:MAG: 16S rRNA (adenine(1518)-N(6)/adenine(1519)-N(6))-dimethyltransferase RsmA [Leptospirillum sp.]|jgi:16S rRNA (adenine1518-N6/adenine1519-N6)-dimethyltransferase
MEKMMMTPPHRARKSLGQNFLTDPSIAQKIADFLDPGIPRETPVIEIGPGKGILTKALLSKTSNLVLLEKDQDLLPALTERYGSSPGVRIIQTDALEYPFGEGEDYLSPPFSGGGYRIVSNLPYNISVPLLFRFLSSPKPPLEMVLMFQREVARRIVASPGSDDYGHLSVAMALSASSRKVLDLKPGSFFPAPKVHSSVVVIRPRIFDTKQEREQTRQALNLSRKLFSYRRRTLQNAARLAFPEIPKGYFEEVFNILGIPPEKRVERLLPEELLLLSTEIHKKGLEQNFT